MSRILVTAFEPYGDWEENGSWLTLVELTKELPPGPHVTTRRYPVDFDGVQARLEEDLAEGYDFAVHLGQSPRDAVVTLESVAVNVRGEPESPPDDYGPIAEDGPAAYGCRWPLGELAGRLSEEGIPAQVSYHAGTYLCNGILYLSHHVAAQLGQRTAPLFLHLPIDTSQAVGRRGQPSLPVSVSAQAVRLVLEELHRSLDGNT